MSGCFFALSILFFIIGLVQLLAPSHEAARQETPADTPWPRPSANPIAQSASPNRPVEKIWSDPPENIMGEGMNNPAQKLGWIQLGQRLTVSHPVKGELMAHVLGSILYSELWQRTKGAQSPWVATGNRFLGFWLEGDLFLLSWQNRFYILDEAVALSDADIQRDFAPHARKFAQSDQTAEVYFAYPPAMWRMVDIGKFRVDEVMGEGLRFQPGAVGRFIHASGDSGRALVVEDYETGGAGQDTAWVGYQIEETGIQAAG